QAAPSRPARIRIRYAGEVAEVGTHLLRSAVLAGLLNVVLDEKVNVVNAPQVAAARHLAVEEETRRREHGFPNTLEVSALPDRARTPRPTPTHTPPRLTPRVPARASSPPPRCSLVSRTSTAYAVAQGRLSGPEAFRNHDGGSTAVQVAP